MAELYRHYAEDGTLLYVGISISALSRLSEHKRESSWYSGIAKITIERWASRDMALLAEKRAIERERPLFNKVWQKRNYENGGQLMSLPEAKRMLVEQGQKKKSCDKCKGITIVRQSVNGLLGVFYVWRLRCPTCGKKYPVSAADIRDESFNPQEHWDKYAEPYIARMRSRCLGGAKRRGR